MRQFLVKRVSVRRPSVFPELFAMIGDHDNQGVVQNSELLELANQLLQAPVVVQDLAVVTIPGALNKAIGIDPEKATLWVGPKLQFDPHKEKFVNNAAANKLLTRAYRKPFVVPEQV